MVSALVPDRAVRVRALTGDTVLCSWAKHFTPTVPLSIQEYKWVAASCYGSRDKLRLDEPVWLQGFTHSSCFLLIHFE